MRTGKSGFEIDTCSRCGGSGRHSFNQIDGDRCYGCGGSGVKATKRGRAAREYYENSMRRLASEVKAGEWIVDSISGNWAQVKDVTIDGSYALVGDERIPFTNLVTDGCVHGFLPGSKVTSVATMEERDQKRTEALAYQETLTKAGTVRVRRAA